MFLSFLTREAEQIPEARHSTATYCASEIFFPLAKAISKDNAPRVTKWNLRKRNAMAVQSKSLPADETIHFEDSPRDACVLLTMKISMTDAIRRESRTRGRTIPTCLPLITKLTSLFFFTAGYSLNKRVRLFSYQRRRLKADYLSPNRSAVHYYSLFRTFRTISLCFHFYRIFIPCNSCVR